MLKTILLTLFALLILIPTLYLVPNRFSNKGKMILILLSFFLAFIGILANTMFYLWQTASILLLLAILCSFLIIKRSASSLYILAEENHPNMVVDTIEKSTPQKKFVVEQERNLPEDDLENLNPNDDHHIITEIIPKKNEPLKVFKDKEVIEEPEETDESIEDFFKNREILFTENEKETNVDSIPDPIKKERTYLDQDFDVKQVEADNNKLLEEDDDFIIKEIDFSKK